MPSNTEIEQKVRTGQTVGGGLGLVGGGLMGIPLGPTGMVGGMIAGAFGGAYAGGEYSRIAAENEQQAVRIAELQGEVQQGRDTIGELSTNLQEERERGAIRGLRYVRLRRHFERQLQQKNQRITALETSTQEKDQRITALELSTQEKDQRITALELSTQEKDQRITALELSTQEKDQRITALELSTQEKDQRITALETSTQEKDQRITGLQGQVNTLSAEVKELGREVHQQVEARVGEVLIRNERLEAWKIEVDADLVKFRKIMAEHERFPRTASNHSLCSSGEGDTLIHAADSSADADLAAAHAVLESGSVANSHLSQDDSWQIEGKESAESQQKVSWQSKVSSSRTKASIIDEAPLVTSGYASDIGVFTSMVLSSNPNNGMHRSA